MTESDIAAALTEARTIAVVGLSPREDRPSWGVARYLKSQGYRIIPVNPGQAGKLLLDELVYPNLAAIPREAEVDMVDIFRRSEAVPALVDEALAALPALRTIWMQLGITSPVAAEKARAAGVRVIEDRCPKIELPRLQSGLHSV
ncbi:CoA-binding protein [Paracoccus aminophilus]|uniref:CoA-binding domain-containing protein n=1 Tax=Paracoccus aminophilus JCM 7686 TaxID=1367847 RepID=S5XPG1_PARAH|nr:CoA-binding protein [Paracoccus aminophilus]AGT09224.1 CoA-binding domain-containing protein [Paracoccus aminophilus JCM 7686]